MPVIDEKQELAKKADLATKQDTLIPGTNITIAADGKTISAAGGGNTVSVSPSLSSGTPIAAITVDGNINTLFAPTPPTISITQTQLSGVDLATITVNGTPFTIYAPEGTVVLSGTSAPTSAQGNNNDLYVQYTVTSGVYTVDMTYVKLSGAWVELSAGGGTGNVDDVYVNGTSVLDSNKIAQITSYREVTQAEYDALPASKESDNVLYCINDQATADTTVAPIIYSEEEREVGVWTDGKPLYQKTWRFTSSVTLASGWTQLPITKDELEQCAYADAGADDGTILSYISVSLTQPTYIYVFNARNASVVIDFITIRYTKTTDIPGSGKWAPSGVPAVHYSTNEQVIGTWIDGSTLYEKTIDKSNDPVSVPALTWVTFTTLSEQINILNGFAFNNATVGTDIEYTTVPICFNCDTNNNLNIFNVRQNATMVVKYITIQYTKSTTT